MLGEFRVKGDERIYKQCPFCGNAKWNFQVSFSKGVYHDWACGKGGRVKELVALGMLVLGSEDQTVDVVPEYHDVVVSLDGCVPLVGSRPGKVWDYFKSRGFDEEDAAFWNVHVRLGTENLVFPLQYGEKYRYYVEKDVRTGEWHCPKGVPKKGWYWLRMVNPVCSEAVLVEGMFDGMRVAQAGYNVVILLGTLIQKSLGSYLKSRALYPVIMLDSDVKSVVYEELSQKFRGVKHSVVRCPLGKDPADLSCEDIRELLCKGGPNAHQASRFRDTLAVHWSLK